jgi:para-aminobenzoate synthetase/4-amino-4-deoxychorismate lyase
MIARCLIRNPNTDDWLDFDTPVDVLVATELTDVVPLLRDLESRVEQEHLYAVGFICYEAAPAFDPALTTHPPDQLPLLAFGLFQSPAVIPDHQLPDACQALPAHWQLEGSQKDHATDIASIRAAIADGSVYQINHTLRLRAADVDPWSLFRNIAGDADYAAYIDTDAFAIVSASPELFFDLDGDRLTCMPMKGTASRGVTTAADRKQSDWLARSEKNRAENLMITDMVRNDLGRIAISGSVETTNLFKVQRHPTVWQMTSTVSCQTQASICEIFANLFPGASITGAPKNASMRMIRKLETQTRGIYTGAIGYLQPGRRARFSIAIRTARVDKPDQRASYGAGGGIVWDSDPEGEFEELLSKTQILKDRPRRNTFQLLETLLWQPGSGYVLLEEHLQRLAGSASYFDFDCKPADVRQQLAEYSTRLHHSDYRIRLLVDRAGLVTIESQPLTKTPAIIVPLQIYPEPVDVTDPMLYHKTSYRVLYDRALAWAKAGHEALLVNPNGFITESTIANLVYEMDGVLYTPPISSGLLPGTFRASLLKAGRIAERALHRSELARCAHFWLINSLRGWRQAQFAHQDLDASLQCPD